eukprot:TRINITY_DN67195_c4_g2_i1.p1 TRINITY_DN67195_c4_g2~~TRINITY_DN67195_c4_g2_i1.p1  ORF type:complete len:577 (-),score=35.41 TRINITY_DN67195_c4_g2_i1:23-1753(-)
MKFLIPFRFCPLPFFLFLPPTPQLLLKIWACTPMLFWKEHWNRFDFVVVTVSVFGLIFNAGGGASAFRALRVLRVLRVIKSAKGLQHLLKTLVFSLPAMYNITALLFVVFFVFAILGMGLLGHVARSDLLTAHVNFESFPTTMLTLYRAATTDNWFLVMRGTWRAAPYECSEELNDCGSEAVSRVYFAMFMILGGFVTLNLFIAVVLENFSGLETVDDDRVMWLMEVFHDFKNSWERKDYDADRMLHVSQLLEVLWIVVPPVGLRDPFLGGAPVLRELGNLDLKVTPKEHEVCFKDALQQFARRSFGIRTCDDHATLRFLGKSDTKRDVKMYGDKPFYVVEFLAVNCIECWWMNLKGLSWMPTSSSTKSAMRGFLPGLSLSLTGLPKIASASTDASGGGSARPFFKKYFRSIGRSDIESISTNSSATFSAAPHPNSPCRTSQERKQQSVVTPSSSNTRRRSSSVVAPVLGIGQAIHSPGLSSSQITSRDIRSSVQSSHSVPGLVHENEEEDNTGGEPPQPLSKSKSEPVGGGSIVLLDKPEQVVTLAQLTMSPKRACGKQKVMPVHEEASDTERPD